MWLLGLPHSMVARFQEQVSQHELGRSPTTFLTSPCESHSIPSSVATNLPRFREGKQLSSLWEGHQSHIIRRAGGMGDVTVAVFIKHKLPHTLIPPVEGSGLADVVGGGLLRERFSGRKRQPLCLGPSSHLLSSEEGLLGGQGPLLSVWGTVPLPLPEWGYRVVTATGRRSFWLLKCLLSA